MKGRTATVNAPPVSARARILAASARVSGHPLRELFVRVDGAGAIARSVQQRQQPAEGGLIVRQQVEGAAGPGGRLGHPAFALAPLDQETGRRGRGAPQRLPPAIEPLLEIGRGALHVQPVEEGAAIQGERALRVTGLQGMLQIDGVAAQCALRHRDLLVAARLQDLGSEPLAEKVERAAEGGPRVLLVEVGPEEGEERVAPVESAGRVGGEIGEDREALRLAQYRAGLHVVRGAEVYGAEGAELDHRRGER